MDIQTFFRDALPSLIKQRFMAFDANHGSVCLNIHGVGAWTLRFGDHKHPQALEEGLELDADLVATWSATQFQALIDGDVDGAEEPITIGDASLLGHLGTLLMPPAKGGLGARLMF